MAQTQQRMGGSFAPPLDQAKLKTYGALAADAPEQVKDAMIGLLSMVQQYQQHAPSRQRGTPHPSGRGRVVPLEPETIKAIGDSVPWEDELTMLAQVFDRIDPVEDKDLRDAAHHLLWWGRELNLDREPLTTEKLGK